MTPLALCRPGIYTAGIDKKGALVGAIFIRSIAIQTRSRREEDFAWTPDNDHLIRQDDPRPGVKSAGFTAIAEQWRAAIVKK